MKPSIMITSAVFAALVAAASPSMARDELDRSQAEAVQLKDGSTLYTFKDGKMALEDKFGRATPIKKGQTFEAKDGRKLTASSSESARLNTLIERGHGGQ
ncbi:MAG TPA: CopK family periplasmic copper-binding protein [Methylibium sp.]|uniref:CopK family periplasmic copper-binding protein n=1 Tax=Methylibium sp. TaxID=2067992 RepID=UPI002DB6E7BC|nr:CopK family periplasmic copper-binding protein [Methylibium sp.]HEU4459932.1 CopK family periplasmic copper-binding protein [Methylibium sp.]